MERHNSAILHRNLFNFSIFLYFQAYRESVRVMGWVRPRLPIYHPDQSKKYFLVLAPNLNSNEQQYRHILRVKYGSSNLQQSITYGNFEVEKIHGWDSTGKHM